MINPIGGTGATTNVSQPIRICLCSCQCCCDTEGQASVGNNNAAVDGKMIRDGECDPEIN